MKTRAALSSYEQVEFSITTTAPVSDWRAALKQFEKMTGDGWVGWPLSGFTACIRKMLEDLDKTHADAVLHKDQANTPPEGT